MTITWMTFAVRLLVGFFLAVGIGIERQWLKTRAVLKTNVLVTLGSAMFVMLSIMTPGDASPTRISAQIVSGVGFLGGGVILREGASVRGINTAATLWCAAAIGTLVGSGFLIQAYVSTVAIVGANLLLRPLVEAFKQQTDQEEELELQSERNGKSKNNINKILPLETAATLSISNPLHYSCHLFCSLDSETEVLKLMMNFARERKLMIASVQSRNIEQETKLGDTKVEIKANFTAQSAESNLLDSEEIIRMLKSQAKVSSISWQLLLS